MLNTLEPTMTPAPTCCWWRATAVVAAVISGESAASAATTPSSASDSPNRSPRRSIRDTSTQLARRLTIAPAANRTTSSAGFTPGPGRRADCGLPQVELSDAGSTEALVHRTIGDPLPAQEVESFAGIAGPDYICSHHIAAVRSDRDKDVQDGKPRRGRSRRGGPGRKRQPGGSHHDLRMGPAAEPFAPPCETVGAPGSGDRRGDRRPPSPAGGCPPPGVLDARGLRGRPGLVEGGPADARDAGPADAEAGSRRRSRRRLRRAGQPRPHRDPLLPPRRSHVPPAGRSHAGARSLAGGTSGSARRPRRSPRPPWAPA